METIGSCPTSQVPPVFQRYKNEAKAVPAEQAGALPTVPKQPSAMALPGSSGNTKHSGCFPDLPAGAASVALQANFCHRKQLDSRWQLDLQRYLASTAGRR